MSWEDVLLLLNYFYNKRMVAYSGIFVILVVLYYLVKLSVGSAQILNKMYGSRVA